MSDAITATTPAVQESPAPPGKPLLLVRKIGYAVLGAQLACFGTWSAVLYHRFALTFDFAVYHQAWFLIAHGNLNPYSSISRHAFWRNDAEFAIWPLAPLYWIWPHDVILLWLQDAGVVAAEAVAFGWICELAGRCGRGRDGAVLAGTGLVLLAANPWIWWSVSFDFHEEALAIPFAVLLARDLAHGRRRMWLWLVPILAAGAPEATYVIGIGLGGAAAWRRTRWAGALLIAAGLAYSLLIVYLHADAGAPLARHYGYLAAGAAGGYLNAKLTTADLLTGIASHPLRVLHAIWAKRLDVVANLAPSGLLGAGFLLVLPLMLVVLLADTLSPGFRFAEPLFQALPIYVLMPIGTVAVLAWLALRHRRAVLLLAGLLIAQTLGWAAVWGPRTSDQWLRVSAPAAATLASIAARIPPSAEVIASQGVIGRLSGRADVHELARSRTAPVDRGDVWFVIAPSAGTELQSTASAMAFIGELAGPLRARLVAQAHGIWAFDWHPPLGARHVAVPGGSAPIPAWTAAGAAGRDVLTGPAATWHVTSAGSEGYVADGLAWQEPTGRYQVTVILSSTGPVNVEVWNDTGDVLLARRSIPSTSGTAAVTVPVNAQAAYRAVTYSGWGPFRATFVAPPRGERLEVRVWTPGGGAVNVYGARIAAAGHPRTP